MKYIKLLALILLVSFSTLINAAIWVEPDSGTAGDEFYFYIEMTSKSLDAAEPMIRLYDGTSIVIEAPMKRITSKKYYYSKPITKAGNRKYAIGVKGTTGYLWFPEKYYTVNELQNNRAPSISKYGSATTGNKVGDSATVRITATDPDGNFGTVQINWGDEGDKAYLCSKYSGDIFQCSHIYQSVGTFSWAVIAYDNGNPKLSSNRVKGNIIVSSNVPTITSVLNASPLSAVAGSNFTFNCTLSGSLPAGYGIYLNFGSDPGGFLTQYQDGGHVNMGSDCSHTTPINTDGTRLFRIGIFDSNHNLVGSYATQKSFTVEAPQIQNNPTIAMSGTPANNVQQGSAYSVTLSVSDIDGNLKNIEINWGDGTLTDGLSVTGSSDLKTLTHIYTTQGNYRWSAAVKDHTGRSSSSVGHAVSVQSTALPIVTTPKITQISNTSDVLKFEVTLSAPLPSGYGVFINFDDQQGEWFVQNTPGGHMALTDQVGSTYSIDYTLVKPGLRSVRAGIFNTLNNTDHLLEGNYSAKTTCMERICLTGEKGITKINGYGDPGATGSGSQLFKQVDVANGNYHLSMVDISVPGKGPSFAFSRAYNSLSDLPSKWTFGYEAKATYLANTFNRQISIGPREDGRMQHFFKDMNEDGGLWYALNPGNFDQLVENSDGTFVLYTQGNRLYRFTDPSGGQAGRLESIEDRLGNALTFSYINDNLIGAKDANGNSYTITRDGSNRIQRVTDFSGRYVSYTYDSNSMITSVRNMRGEVYRYTYAGTTGNNRYRLASSIDPRGNAQVSITYTLNGKVQRLHDGFNQIAEFIYSTTNGKPYTGVKQPVVDSLNHNIAFILDAAKTRVEERLDAHNYKDYKTQQEYQVASNRNRLADQGLISKVVDPKLNTITIAYTDDGKGNPNIITDALGHGTIATYGADESINGQKNLTPVTSVTQPGIATPTRYQTFTKAGQARVILDPKGNRTDRAFDSATGLLTQVQNPRRFTTHYAYDTNGNPSLITDPLGNITDLTYDQLGRLETEKSPLGLTTSYTYDEHGNVLTRTEQATGFSYKTEYGYDASDNLVWTIDPLLNQTNYEYDRLNRKIKESYTVAGIPHIRSYTYDAMGRLATVTNERNQTSQTHYDSRSKMKYKVNPRLETTVSYTYDKNGNVETVTDGEGRTVTYEYDVLNRKTKATDAQGNYQQWFYNTAGQVMTYRDSRGQYTQYEYDATGNLTKLTDPSNGITRSTYDENGNVVTVTDPNGHTTTYTYDALDRRISTTLHNGQQWLYSYDANGNQLSEKTPTGERTVQTYDVLNRIKTLTEYSANSSIIRQISYTYDANSNVLTETSSGNTISYTYDEINRVTSVTDQYGQTIGYGYDKAGNRTTLTYPGNKIVQYAYDETDRLSSLTDWLNKTTTYTRYKTGQPKDVVNGNGTKSHYKYDTAGRLTQLLNQKADGTTISSHNLTLDGAGNITQATVDLPLLPTLPVSTGSMSYDNSNRILSAGGNSYTHDKPGRIIEENRAGIQTSYNFDINDHITSITRAGTALSSYGYDLNNNRIQQIQGGVETRYVIDQLAPLPNVVAETNSSGVVTNYYLYGEGLVSQISATNESHYYHFDPTGHTLALTDASGNVSDRYAYSPYGFTTSQGSTPNPFRYVGKHGVMDDGNGLHYMRARYYKEDIKRFVSLDGLHGSMASPQALNRYAYVLGNPVMGVDPSGLSTKSILSDLKASYSKWLNVLRKNKSIKVRKFAIKKLRNIRKQTSLVKEVDSIVKSDADYLLKRMGLSTKDGEEFIRELSRHTKHQHKEFGKEIRNLTFKKFVKNKVKSVLLQHVVNQLPENDKKFASEVMDLLGESIVDPYIRLLNGENGVGQGADLWGNFQKTSVYINNLDADSRMQTARKINKSLQGCFILNEIFGHCTSP